MSEIVKGAVREGCPRCAMFFVTNVYQMSGGTVGGLLHGLRGGPHNFTTLGSTYAAPPGAPEAQEPERPKEDSGVAPISDAETKAWADLAAKARESWTAENPYGTGNALPPEVRDVYVRCKRAPRSTAGEEEKCMYCGAVASLPGHYTGCPAGRGAER